MYLVVDVGCILTPWLTRSTLQYVFPASVSASARTFSVRNGCQGHDSWSWCLWIMYMRHTMRCAWGCRCSGGLGIDGHIAGFCLQCRKPIKSPTGKPLSKLVSWGNISSACTEELSKGGDPFWVWDRIKVGIDQPPVWSVLWLGVPGGHTVQVVSMHTTWPSRSCLMSSWVFGSPHHQEKITLLDRPIRPSK